jgi:hypothetical protein
LEGVAGRLELVRGSNVYGNALALIYDLAVPVEAESLQGAQDAICAARYDPRGIEILDADQPAAAVMARIEIASDRGQE